MSKYKTLRLLCVECKIKKEDTQRIYHIISKLGPAYSIFVSTFYSMKESLNTASYQEPNLESLIREKDKLIHLGIINKADTYGKDLLFQQKEKSKPPKKDNFRNNNPNNKGPKLSQSTPFLKMTKDPSQKERRLKVIAIFVGKIIMMNLSVSRIWKPWKKQ